MIASETSLWRWLDGDWKTLPRSKLQANRIENAAGSGMPDVEGFYKNTQFWLELKCSPRPVKLSTKIDVKHLRPKQIEWLHNRWLIGGHAWILLRIEGGKGPNTFYLIPGKFSREVKAGLTQAELYKISVISSHPDPFTILESAIAR